MPDLFNLDFPFSGLKIPVGGISPPIFFDLTNTKPSLDFDI